MKLALCNKRRVVLALALAVFATTAEAAAVVEEEESFSSSSSSSSSIDEEKNETFTSSLIHPAVRGGVVDLDNVMVSTTSTSRREMQFCAGRGQNCNANVRCCNTNDRCINNICTASGCLQRFETCFRTADCCEPWHCRQNVCDTVNNNQCSPLNGACRTSANCCAGLQCGDNGFCVRGGPSSCVGFNAVCTFNSDCCNPFICNQRTGRCDYSNSGTCAQLWQTCARTSDCCGDLHCRQNQCNRGQCGVDGQTCRSSVDCCSANPCVNGICNSGSSGSTCANRNCNSCLNSNIDGSGRNCAWSPSVGCVNSCANAPADASCFPSTSYSPQGICPNSLDCRPLNSVCQNNGQCCNPNSNFCSGGRCARRGSGGCSTTPGAACQNDSDCCGPNNVCDRAGFYCRHL